jgi:serine phosphatase RsbU (regulator of sigma subunit)
VATGAGQLAGEHSGSADAPLEALLAASRTLLEGAGSSVVLEAIVAAAARATAADLAIARVIDPDARRLSARAVFSSSPTLAAELTGSRIEVDGLAAEPVDESERLPAAVREAAERAGGKAILLVPVILDGDIVGTLELARNRAPFGPTDRVFGRLAANQVGTAIRAFRDSLRNGRHEERDLELAGEALRVGAGELGLADEVARLALDATGASSCLLWLREADEAGLLELAVTLGTPVEPARVEQARQIAEAALEPGAPAVLEGSGWLGFTTVQLGQPAIGVLQLAYAQDATRSRHPLKGLAGFGVRAAHALQAGERVRTLELELERTRALLAVVAQANEELSLAHTLTTAVDRVAELLGAERVGVYLREQGQLAAAAGYGLGGPHAVVAERLLELILGPFRGHGMLLVEDAGSDRRLAGLERELAQSGIEAAVAAPLIVPDEVIGLLALYPPRGRVLTSNEWTLLGALVAQLAVSVQNARLHERAKQLGAELEQVLSLERQAARQLRALYEISRAFAQSLSLETTLDAVARTVVELLHVDAAVIRMPDGRGDLLVPHAMHVADARLDEAIRTMLLHPQPLEKLPGRRLFRMGKPLVLDAAMAERLEAHRLLVPFLEKGSTAVVVPIATPTELLGTLMLLSLDRERPITEETSEIALSVATQAALAIDNARLYQQQKEFADKMQYALLPRSQPRLSGLELGHVYESSARVDVGGDFYDFLPLPDGRLAVCLGDVTGHGIDAAADMAMAKYVFRLLAREHPDPAEFLGAANQVVCGEVESGKFISMLYLTIAPEGELACASAGHPPPLLVHPNGRVQAVEAGGLVLGIDAGQEYEEARALLGEGAIVVLYTDGVVEARREGELYGRERLEQVLSEHRMSSPDELVRAVVADCRSFSRGELIDDCAVVAIRRPG